MKIYHYTKGIHLNSIFTDGFIATEQTRNLNYSKQATFATDLAWFTEKNNYPITALPFISTIPSTNLTLQKTIKNLHTDYVEISAYVGLFWRFSFDSKNQVFEKWHFSQARQKALNNPLGRNLEKIANDVGDEPRRFWISNCNVPLENATLEALSPTSGQWESIIEEFSISDTNPNTQGLILDLCNISEEYCHQLTNPQLALKKAA